MPTTPEQQEILDSLAEAAVELEVLLPERCSIVRRNVKTETTYGTTTSTTPVATDVPCRRGQLTGREASNATRTNSTVELAIVFPLGTDVRLDDEVHVGGRRYTVHALPNGTYSVQVKALVKDGGTL